jgi:hypothetical protein
VPGSLLVNHLRRAGEQRGECAYLAGRATYARNPVMHGNMTRCQAVTN